MSKYNIKNATDIIADYGNNARTEENAELIQTISGYESLKNVEQQKIIETESYPENKIRINKFRLYKTQILYDTQK